MPLKPDAQQAMKLAMGLGYHVEHRELRACDYGAPTILLIFETPECVTPTLDGAAVCTNLLNAACAAGLGSCWINRCQYMFQLPEGKALLMEWGLPEDLTGVASIALGYADCELPKPKPRKADYIKKV